jgi:hypothetical protein
MARQLNGLSPVSAILKHSLSPTTRRPRTLAHAADRTDRSRRISRRRWCQGRWQLACRA